MSVFIRQFHRWTSMVFMLGVIVNTVVIFGMGKQQPPYWVYMLALIPLFVLMPTGIYLFVLPYLRRRA